MHTEKPTHRKKVPTRKVQTNILKQKIKHILRKTRCRGAYTQEKPPGARHICNHSTYEGEAGGLRIQDQTRLYNETLSEKKKIIKIPQNHKYTETDTVAPYRYR